jgi:hypothetical protein
MKMTAKMKKKSPRALAAQYRKVCRHLELARATLKVIRTWAQFATALNNNHVTELCVRTLKETELELKPKVKTPRY